MTHEIPGYTLKREIGSGGMASVYLAVQESLDRRVALKVMSPALVADRTFTKRFLREAKTVAALNHRNIVSVFDVGVTDDQLHYFSMEFLPNGDFADRIKRGCEQKDVIRTLIAIATALGYAHEQGYVHRDVKPGNILFDPTDVPILSDFGIARAATNATRMTGTGVSVGTSHYMSPEQARGKEVDGRSDLYSLGVVAYEALTGSTPFDGEDGFAIAYSHVFDPVPRLPEAVAEWQPFIDRALAKRQDERFQSAQEMIVALRQMKAGEAIAPESAGPIHATTPVPAVGSQHKPTLQQRLAVLMATLRGVPGSKRFEFYQKLERGMMIGQHYWRVACHKAFPFLDPQQRPIAGLVGVFLLIAIVAMVANLGDDAAPETPAVADQTPAQTPAQTLADTGGEAAADADSDPPTERPAAPPAPVDRTPESGGTDPVTRRDAAIAAADDIGPTAADDVDEPAAPVIGGTDDALLVDQGDGAETPVPGAALDPEEAGFDPLTSRDGASPDGFTLGLPAETEDATGDAPAEPLDAGATEVESLLALAATDLAEDRLTTPADSNALDRYTAVLDLDPENEAAKAGLDAIVDRYFILSRAAFSRGDFPAAVRLLDRAARVGERSGSPERVDDVRQTLATQLEERADELEAAGENPTAALQALLRLRPGDEALTQRIARAGQESEPVRRFRDELSDGTSGPEMIVVSLEPFALDVDGQTLEIGESRSIAVSATEVTVAEFGRFVNATRHYSANRMAPCRERDSAWRASRRRDWSEPGFAQSDDHPVVCVTWEDATAMATWLSSETGNVYRLPTEAEWEFLAQHVTPDGATPCEADNVGDIWMKAQESGRDAVDCEDGWAYTAPVSAFPAAGDGFSGFFGNVREWTVDCWNDSRAAGSRSYSPTLSGECGKRVIKGASWYDADGFDDPAWRLGFGDDDAYNTVGFRVVRVLGENDQNAP
ncbi:MAG: SUMF1/EgtB/PvdO family nonheme iron enzyme [Pseudomonadota bacterium]